MGVDLPRVRRAAAEGAEAWKARPPMTKAEREVHRLRRRARSFRVLGREADRRCHRFTLFLAVQMLETLEGQRDFYARWVRVLRETMI